LKNYSLKIIGVYSLADFGQFILSYLIIMIVSGIIMVIIAVYIVYSIFKFFKKPKNEHLEYYT